MLLSRQFILASIVFLVACGKSTADAEICPSKTGKTLRYVDVFDGSPEELATLVPDSSSEKTGYWQLGYIYDAGRFVTVRCKYNDGDSLDTKIAQRIDKCSYSVNGKQVLKITCQ